MSTPAPAPTPDWLRLQRKIFSRWVNLKVAKKDVRVNDVVTDMTNGTLLIALMEVLSEKAFAGKYVKDPKNRAQQLDNCTTALKFTLVDCGVQMKLKPSPQDLVDGDEKNILGLVWAIMLKYIKIGDEEDGAQLNAKDALLMWLQNKISDYKNVQVEKFGKDFHNGLALCALIHKHRPKLIQYDTLNPDDKIKNLQIAMDAAEKYFGLEQYLTPDDIPKLDENSMVIYISEYYYGIAEQMKVDLAARRISKLIKLTEENDALKLEFNKTGQRFLEHLKKVEGVLEDRSIDNTMAGAKKRLEDFYKYKTEDKNMIIADQLSLEGLFNTLSMRLAHNKRPEYVPPAGLSLKDIESAIAHLEACEQERSVALHAELNRQIKLVNMDNQHQSRYDILKTWIAEKEAYLKKKEEISSVSSAQLHIRLLDAFDKESVSVKETTVVTVKKIGAELQQEKYENISKITQREEDIEQCFQNLASLSTAKRPVLLDDLAREQFKEKVRLMNKRHIRQHNILKSWIAEKEAYLNKKESIQSVGEAQTQLSLLETYEKDKIMQSEISVTQFKALGAEILAQKYETQYSSWVFEYPQEIKDRESFVADKWEVLTDLSAEKKRVLDDDLARELFKEKVRTMNTNHVVKHDELQSWIAEKENYLNTKEEISSISEATTQLSYFKMYEEEKKSTTENNVTILKKLGAEILAQKYETKYSSWVFETPEEIKNREQSVDSKWDLLSQLSAEKKKVLDDHLAREEFKERVRLMNKNHIGQSNTLQSWIAEKEVYLNTRETVESVASARTELSLLETYEQDKINKTETSVAQLKALGVDILAQKYETVYSSYVFENPSEISERETSVDDKWNVLASLSEEKKRVLDDHLAREEFREIVRLMNANHIAKHAELLSWVTEKETYLNTKEHIDSVSEAQTQLSLLEEYEKEKVSTHQNYGLNLNSLGQEILAQKYETKYSSWVFPTPEEVKEREAAIDAKWEHLTELSNGKKKILDEDLAREMEKERLRLEFSHLAAEFTRWVKDVSDNAEASHFGFTLEDVEAYEAVLKKQDSDAASEADKKKSDYDHIFKTMTEMGVKENIYTESTLESLGASQTSMEAKLEVRQKAYQTELARQRANDALCKEFAGLADPFSKSISEQKEIISNSKKELEEQLKYVEEKIAGITAGASKLEDISKLNAKMTEAGITNIRHTTLTLKDLEVQWEQYQAFLKKKQQMLQEEIDHAKLRGLTLEQLKEIEENFKKFDKDNSNSIDRKELKACLYSLGEEKTASEVTNIMAEFGKPDSGMSFEGFREFMIHVLGDSNTKDEILEGFKLINRGGEVTKVDSMALVMGEHDVDYIKATAPAVDGGYNYSKWTEDVFSR